MQHLTCQSISAHELRLQEKFADCGSIVTFEGAVRNNHAGKSVTTLIYEAYEAMADKEITRLQVELKKRWPMAQVAVKHRLGKLEIGDVAVAIVVWTPHRKEGFEACRFMIDEIKKRVPIFKKETYADNSTSWVVCSHPGVSHEY